MLNFDVREIAFWFRQAQKKLITEQLKRINAVRIGMAQDSDYQKAMGEYEGQLRELDIGRDTMVKQSWDDLRLFGRKRK